MSGAISLFKMPATFARENYPIVQKEGAAATNARAAAKTETPNQSPTTASPRGEHEVTTAFTSLLRGNRRPATA